MSEEVGITPTEGNYLKFIYRKQVEEGRKVGTKMLADFFKVHPATVTEMLQKLDERGLLRYERYYGVEFTDEGIHVAQKMLRKHRLLEVLFVNFLKCDVESACKEASKLDYYLSENITNRICRMYGHPETCPCNKTIFRDEKCCGCIIEGEKNDRSGNSNRT